MLRKILPLVLITFISAALAVEVELKWDNGTPSYAANGPGSAAHGFGNYFDVATLKTSHVSVRRFRIYTADVWPNGRWDGFFLSLYDFRGGVPASRIWPTSGGAFFEPTGSGWRWYDYSLDFALEKTTFLAAADAIYNWPNCDPLMVDTNPAGRGHSWAYYSGSWAPFDGPYGYSNLMLRVVVETEATYPGVAPSSWGRIKGLYY
ncbi:MAG: hypothetical protein V3W11_08000 [bacterium]